MININVPPTPCDSLDIDERDFRKRALRDASLCIGWFKMMSVLCYISLFYLVKFYGNGDLSFILGNLLLIAMIPTVFLGLLLFLGALQECGSAIYLAFYTCILLATYDLLVGIFGAAYYTLIADNVIHYILTLAFVLLSLSCFPAFCHDAYIINTYRNVLKEQNSYLTS